MKKLIIVIMSLLANQTFSSPDTLDIRNLVRNLFDAKLNYEGGIILSDSSAMKGMSKSNIAHFFTKKGITSNVDSLGKIYDLNIQLIKNNKTDFSLYYYNLSNITDVPTYTIYYFMHPYSSTVGKGAIMSYHQCVKVVKHFLIDLDRSRLPPLDEAIKYLESTT